MMDFYISTEKSKLDVSSIHYYISNSSYWGKGRSFREVETTIEHSLCFGMYLVTQRQIGFARVVTDYTIFAYLMDVFIFKEYRGRGYGKELVAYIMDHEVLRTVKTIALKTRDSHGLYKKFGFREVGDSPFWMVKDNVILS
jgi:GNAT superfamily N-acetyltransferase